jgi:outer membrane protein assembly factor BamB
MERIMFIKTIYIALFATTLPFLSTPASGQVIRHDFSVAASDGEAADMFGYSTDIDNNLAIVGAQLGTFEDFYIGSAYIFHTVTGNQIMKLTSSDGAFFDHFGFSVAVEGNIAAVGAPQNFGVDFDSGAVYLFEATTGEQIAKLIPNDATRADRFGSSIAMSNGIIAIGASSDSDMGLSVGSAYLFDATTGTQLMKLLPSDGVRDDNFGRSIAIDNNIVAVGSFHGDEFANSGSVYLFDATTGDQIMRITPNGPIAQDDNFGSAIAMHNGLLAVGAPGEEDNIPNSGAAYLFDVATGTQLTRMVANDAMLRDYLGTSIAINDDAVFVGAPFDNHLGIDTGSVYTFDIATGNQITKIHPNTLSDSDGFGVSLASDANRIIVGSRRFEADDSPGGGAHIFSINPPPPCSADLTGDGLLDFFDVSAFLTAFIAQDPLADFTDDDLFNFFDVSAFLAAFAAGCP